MCTCSQVVATSCGYNNSSEKDTLMALHYNNSDLAVFSSCLSNLHDMNMFQLSQTWAGGQFPRGTVQHLHSSVSSRLSIHLWFWAVTMETRTRRDVYASCWALRWQFTSVAAGWRAGMKSLSESHGTLMKCQRQPPLTGSYLLHQVFWQVSKPHDITQELVSRAVWRPVILKKLCGCQWDLVKFASIPSFMLPALRTPTFKIMTYSWWALISGLYSVLTLRIHPVIESSSPMCWKPLLALSTSCALLSQVSFIIMVITILVVPIVNLSLTKDLISAVTRLWHAISCIKRMESN